MSGPACSPYEEAIEGLLEATDELVTNKLSEDFNAFEVGLQVPVADGWVLESVAGS